MGPGSILEWNEEGDKIVVRRAGRFTFEEIHDAVFGSRKAKPRNLDELKDGIRQYVQKRYARD
ncbi:MAG: AbrB/MazE/SpoVT family DNA-binding domain-containing protein [Bryobacteraceae bacterium]